MPGYNNNYWDKSKKKTSYYDTYDYGYGNKSKKSSYYDDFDDDDYYYSPPKKSYSPYVPVKTSYNYSWLDNTPDVEYDSKTICIKAHPNYTTPSGSTIRDKWYPYKSDFKSDVHNSYYSRSRYSAYSYDYGYDLTQDDEDLIREFARYFFYRSIGDKEYFKPGYDKAVIESKEPFYDSIWEKEIPGHTPTEMAISLFYELKHQQQEEQRQAEKQKQSGDGDDEDGDGSSGEGEDGEDGDSKEGKGKQAKAKKNPAKSVNEMIQKGIPKVDFEMSDFQNPVINQMMDKVKIKDISNKLLMRQLSIIDDFGDQFSIEKEIEAQRVPASHQTEMRKMQRISDMPHAQITEFIRPDLQLRLLKKAVRCNIPVQYKERKQKIVILLDYSGSMATTVKQKWVVSLLIDRCQAVIEEKAEIFFSYFVHDKNNLSFTHLYNKDTVMKFLAKFSTHPNGGGTAIGTIANYVGNCIKNGTLPGVGYKIDFSEENCRPEILIINDGQDSVDKPFEFKTNALSLIDGFNKQLMEYCVKSGGKYIFLDQDGNLDQYTTIPKNKKNIRVSHG